jgi:hypothetical protein
VRLAWREVSSETVKNCWAKARILDVASQADMSNMLAANGARGSMRNKAPMPDEIKADVKAIEQMMNVLGLLDGENVEAASVVQDFLDPAKEDTIEDDAEVTDESLVAIAKAQESGHQGNMERVRDDEDDEEDDDEEEPSLPPTLTLHQARLQAAALLQFCRENSEYFATELADKVGELCDTVQRMPVSARMRERPLTSYFEKIDKDSDNS